MSLLHYEAKNVYGIHFERTRVYIAAENVYTHYAKPLDLNNGNNNYSYPLCAYFSKHSKGIFGTAAKDSRYKDGVFIYDIINFLGKKYTEIPYPESYDIKIKQNYDNTVSFVIDPKTNTSETVDNVFEMLIHHLVETLFNQTESKEISYILTTPPYLTKLQKEKIVNTISKFGPKFIKAIDEPVATVLAYLNDDHEHANNTYIVINLDKNSFTGSIVTVKNKDIKLRYYINDDDLGYSQIKSSYISRIFDKLIQKKKSDNITNKQQLKYKGEIEYIFDSISSNIDYSTDIEIRKCYVEDLWKSLVENIHQKMNILFDFINDNKLENVIIITSGSGCQYALFKQNLYLYFHKYKILNDEFTNLLEKTVIGTALLAHNYNNFKIHSTTYTEDISYGIDFGNIYSFFSCFRKNSIKLTKKFKTFINTTYQPVNKYIDSRQDQILIDGELLVQIKNIISRETRYITTDPPSVFTIPLSYTVNQRYDLKKEVERCGFKVLSLLYSSFAIVISSIFLNKITSYDCRILTFNFGENGNEMCIINKNGKKIELNTGHIFKYNKYSSTDISKLFIDYMLNDENVLDDKNKKLLDDVINSIIKDVEIIYELVDYILIVGDLEKLPKLKNHIHSLFADEKIVYLNLDCISIGAAVYANQLLTKTNDYEIIDYFEYSDVTLGIDLGTTYSCVCYEKNNKLEMVDFNSSKSVPSCLFFEKKNDKITYFLEKYDCLSSKFSPVYDSKRFIGKSYDEILAYNDNNYLFKLIENKKKIYYDIEYNNTNILLSPEDISSTILRELKSRSRERINTAIQKETIIPVVITTPALFTYKQRFETKRAAQKAGLNVLSIINEPTAAAIAYIYNKSIKEKICKIIVYDFGGGTFDLSIVQKKNNNLHMICSDGDDHLGGEDITNTLVDYISEEFKKKSGLSEIENRIKTRIIKQCEIAKIQLSSNDLSIIEFKNKEKNYDYNLTKAKFNDLCKDIVEKTIIIIKRCLEKNNIKQTDIKYILLCGGSSEIPYIKERIEKEFRSMEIRKDINGKQAVANGAAIYANILRGKETNFVKVVDILNHSLYYESKGRLYEVFKKNTQLDECHCYIDIKTEDIGYTSIRIYEEDTMINEFNIWSDYKRNVKVYFDVNSDGILMVSYIINGVKKIMEYQLK